MSNQFFTDLSHHNPDNFRYLTKNYYNKNTSRFQMNKLKTIRWQQRFSNLNKAFNQLKKGLAIEHPSDIEQQGIIKSFEFTFELSWKTLKDYLEAQGVICQFPREVIKQAFQTQIIADGEVWLDMLGKRNLLAHTYNEEIAIEAYNLIKLHYAPQIDNLVGWLYNNNETTID